MGRTIITHAPKQCRSLNGDVSSKCLRHSMVLCSCLHGTRILFCLRNCETNNWQQATSSQTSLTLQMLTMVQEATFIHHTSNILVHAWQMLRCPWSTTSPSIGARQPTLQPKRLALAKSRCGSMTCQMRD